MKEPMSDEEFYKNSLKTFIPMGFGAAVKAHLDAQKYKTWSRVKRMVTSEELRAHMINNA